MQNADAAPAAAVTTTDLAEPERWLASRSRARARRFADARLATRRRVSFRSLAVAAALAVAATGGATAAERSTSTVGSASLTMLKRGSSGPAVAALQSALGIPADGVFGPQTARAVRAYQRAHGLEVDGVAGPATLGALGVSAPKTTTTAPTTTLARIARCESGGDPTAVSADGRYRGKYQFTRATWRSLGGTGDPAAAPEAEQDRLAALLYQREGATPWPVCGARR